MASPEVLTIKAADLKASERTVTLITGGALGIGLSTAQLLHDLHQDNRVIIVDRTGQAQCKAPSSFLNSKRVTFIQCDVTNWDSLRSAFALGIDRFGQLDNVFVNAGINEFGNQLFQDDLDQDGKLKKPDSRVLNIDLDAAVSTLKLAIHHMRHRRDERRGGNIVMTASLAGYLGSAGAPLYSAAKHGMIGLLRALKNDTAKLGISVSLVAPGITLTDLVAGRGEGETLSQWAQRMRQAGVPINDPSEIANVVVWLMCLGQKANGKGMLVQAGQVADVEEGIAKSRKSWMSTEMLELFKGGRNAPLFPNKL